MHQVSLETICPLKAFQLHYCPDNDAKSMVKHLIFLQKFAVISRSYNMGFFLNENIVGSPRVHLSSRLKPWYYLGHKYTDSGCIRRQIFEGKLSVSPYFLHHFLDNNGARMLLKDKLSLKTLGVYIFIIFWPQK